MCENGKIALERFLKLKSLKFSLLPQTESLVLKIALERFFHFPFKVFAVFVPNLFPTFLDFQMVLDKTFSAKVLKMLQMTNDQRTDKYLTFWHPQKQRWTTTRALKKDLTEFFVKDGRLHCLYYEQQISRSFVQNTEGMVRFYHRHIVKHEEFFGANLWLEGQLRFSTDLTGLETSWNCFGQAKQRVHPGGI